MGVANYWRRFLLPSLRIEPSSLVICVADQFLPGYLMLTQSGEMINIAHLFFLWKLKKVLQGCDTVEINSKCKSKQKIMRICDGKQKLFKS
jgi:hypothetical protein